MPDRIRTLVGAAGLTIALAVPLASAQVLYTIQSPTGGSTRVVGLSRSGAVVAGASGSRPFVWTVADGYVEYNTGANFAPATGIPGDGSVVVGDVATLPYDSTLRWTPGGAYENLGDPFNGSVANRRDVVTVMSNAGGSRLVANVERTFSAGGVPRRTPRVWNQSTGAWTALIASPTSDYISAEDMSDDGNTVVGEVGDGSFFGVQRAFVLTPSGGFVTLPGHASGGSYAARAVKSTGDVAVGWAVTPTGFQAASWQSGALLTLDNAAGYTVADAYDTNDTGTLIVGIMSVDLFSRGRGFVWTPTNGMRLLGTYLADYNLSIPSDASLSNIRVSGDGLTIAGSYTLATGPTHSFLAVIPSPASIACAAATCLMFAGRRRR